MESQANAVLVCAGHTGAALAVERAVHAVLAGPGHDPSIGVGPGVQRYPRVVDVAEALPRQRVVPGVGVREPREAAALGVRRARGVGVGDAQGATGLEGGGVP